MNPKFKLAAYAVLLILTAWFGWGFYSNYKAVTQAASEPATNETTSVATTTNVAIAPTNEAPSSNTVSPSTNEPAKVAVSSAPTNAPVTSPPPAKSGSGRLVGYLAAFVGAIIGLGLLIAHDVTQYVGSTTVDLIFDDRGVGQRDPEYEKAEQVWANGKHLDAIQMMRDFLKRNPREQYAALRIAEIYEKDLHNYLAAAMEYEDVLKQKLPPERWGWAAVHLCNLYAKLNQEEKAVTLLQRIADDYPKTAAAKKARARLGLPEPEPEPLEARHTQPAGEPGESVETFEAEAPEPEAPPPPEPPKSSLPPGFRPKK